METFGIECWLGYDLGNAQKRSIHPDFGSDMLIPYSTDAPIYHFPASTIGLIVINVVCFFAFCIGPNVVVEDVDFVDRKGKRWRVIDIEREIERIELFGGDPDAFVDTLRPASGNGAAWRERLILQFGAGLLPWQWITSMFMHADIMHLIGNMIFLWSFGLVLEGKLGNFWFPALYLGLGIAQAVVVQVVMSWSVGGALGASGAIFALLALLVVFAPVNSFDVIFLFVFRAFTFELPIMIFGFIYLALNLTFFFIGGAQMGSEALHLVGFFVGLPVAFVMLTRGYVDCEGYDLISYCKGMQGQDSSVVKNQKAQAKSRRQRSEPPPVAEDPADTRRKFWEQIELALAGDNVPVAIALQHKLTNTLPGTSWKHSHLIAIIKAYLAKKDYANAETRMLEYIDLFADHRFAMQVKLLKIWLHQQRPRHAMRYIRGLNTAFLTTNEQAELKKLNDYARHQVAAGVLEVE